MFPWQMSKRVWRWVLLFIVTGILLTISLIGAINYIVTDTTKIQLYSDAAVIPYNRVGLLLGTSKYVRKGVINPYYQYRIDAAVALYDSCKISFILISGDNSTNNYNEPQTMKRDLIARGIPASVIFLDYAGLHTLDSILRCRDIFGIKHITIISQQFHNERALFIANHKKMVAIGYNAKSMEGRDALWMAVREKLSRVKMLYELLINTQPKYFYGQKIEIK